MRIGIYGGTFNPPHLGHLTAADCVFRMLHLDKLLVIPAGQPPHKDLPDDGPSGVQRLEMTKLAFGSLSQAPQVEVLDLELRRAGKSYTSDTLAAVRERYPEAELWLLMGTDMFLTLQAWHEPQRIFDLAGVAAFGRTEADTEELFSVQREFLYRTYPGARIFTMTIPGVVDISSTELRERLACGEGGHLLPPAVYGYVLRHGLYGAGVDLKRLTLSQLRPVALSYLKGKRVPHVLGTEQEAVRLALHYGEDVERARRAALLHDCTKKLEMPEQLALCRHYGLELDELEQRALKLLHSKTGAEIARDVFGEEEAVCEAIRWHTTGRPGMSRLEKILYLADYIEPTRDFDGVEELRRVCYEDLDAGMVLGLSMTVEEMHQRGNPVHSATLAALEYLRGNQH